MEKITDNYGSELAKVFAKFSAKVETEEEKALRDLSITVETTAKKLVSRGRNEESLPGLPPRVDTGRLRASITHRFKRDGANRMYAEVGTNVDYAAGLEYGTSHTYKHPFMNPALSANKSAIIMRLSKAVKNAT